MDAAGIRIERVPYAAYSKSSISEGAQHMLTAEENERLTRVGPGTPVGNLFRHYWQPVAPMQQLRERRVMPIRLYGQDMVLFLDNNGRMGLVDDRCAHR